MSNDRYLLWAEGVGKSFGRTVVLKAASLWAEPGKVTTLLGRNGSGKTTLLKVAAGVLRPDYGVISYCGDARERQSLARLARQGLMYLPQDRLVAPNYTVGAHLDAFARVFGRADLDAAIEVVGIGDLLDERCGSLSGGERGRVSLAIAFARRPKVLLADEPLVGLTPRDQALLGERLRDLAGLGVAVVTSGHDTGVLLNISDAIIWAVAGTTHHLGTPDEAVAHRQFQREYLGPGRTTY